MATRSGFERWYPEVFENIGTYTVFDLLIKYIRQGRIILDKSRFDMLVTYHDPCHYGRKAERLFGHGYYEEPRWIIDQCVDNWVDLWPARDNQICCGGGGGALVTGYEDERIYYGRRKMEQVKASGAKMLVVPCDSCHGQFDSLKNECGMKDLQVKYLWELVADCLVI